MKASSASASAASSSFAAFGSRSNADSVSVAVPRLRSTAQLPATKPSTRNVAWIRRFFVASALRRSSVMTRVRSWWASRRLSNSGSSRAGAGVSSPGRGASGRS